MHLNIDGLANSSRHLANMSLKDKTVIITGSNTGMGLDAARQCLVLKASRVVLAVRSISKGEAAARYLQDHQTVKDANPNADIKVIHLDLDDFESVKGFSERVKKEFDVLDVLILNAAVNLTEYQVSKSGHERVMQVNIYSNALLVLELLPLLEATAARRGAPSRLTWVGSRAQNWHTVNKALIERESIIAHFNDKTAYSGLMRYGDSKLLVAAFVEEVAKRVPAEKVIINEICPGFIATDIDKNLPWWLKSIVKTIRAIGARNVAEGSGNIMSAAVGAGPESHGKFIKDRELAP